MKISEIYHEVSLVKGSLETLSEMMSETEKKTCVWCLLDSLAEKFKEPLEALEVQME